MRQRTDTRKPKDDMLASHFDVGEDARRHAEEVIHFGFGAEQVVGIFGGKIRRANEDFVEEREDQDDTAIFIFKEKFIIADGGAEFGPTLIHNRSGVGSTVTAVDLNRDGALDILTGGTRGTFIFWGTKGR